MFPHSLGTVYFDYPLEQGLRLRKVKAKTATKEYFDYPLEQGLRLLVSP